MGEPRVNLLGVQWIWQLLGGYRKWEDGNRWFSKICMSLEQTLIYRIAVLKKSKNKSNILQWNRWFFAGYFEKAADSSRFSVKEIETRVSLTLIFFFLKTKTKTRGCFIPILKRKSELKVLWFLNFLKTKSWGYWNKSDDCLLLDSLKRMWEIMFFLTQKAAAHEKS
jgi:hypothetical protein